MWFLTIQNAGNLEEDISYYFIKKEITLVGRKDKDIMIQNDDSISRNHAKLILEDGKLFVQDEKSKYGTFVKRLGSTSTMALGNDKVELNDGEQVVFGRISSKYTVNQKKYRTATSGLTENEKNKLNGIFAKLGVESSEDMDHECTHLTLPFKTSVTRNLIIALSTLKPIVNIKYWIVMSEAFESNKPMPNHQDFLPIVKESLNVSPCHPSALNLNGHRRQLFAGKRFFFANSTQMKEYELIIKSGGGEVLCLSKQFGKMRDFVQPNNILIQPNSQLSNLSQKNEKLFKQIQDVLTSKHLRMVPEIEISLAVINVSTEQWCNPSLKSVTFLFNDSTDNTQGKRRSSDILAPASSNIDSEDKSTSFRENAMKIRKLNDASIESIPQTESHKLLQNDNNFVGVSESAPIDSNYLTSLDFKENIDATETDFSQSEAVADNRSGNKRNLQKCPNETQTSGTLKTDNRNSSEILESTADNKSKKRKNEIHATQESELSLSYSQLKRAKQTDLRSSRQTGFSALASNSKSEDIRNEIDASQEAFTSESNTEKPCNSKTSEVLLSQSPESSTSSFRKASNFRKRNADNSNWEEGLFNFNIKSRKNKRMKKCSDMLQPEIENDAIIIPSKESDATPQTHSNVQSFQTEDSAAVWLNKKFISIQINESHRQEQDSVDNGNSHMSIINDSNFNLVRNVDMTAATPSRGKTFVKKHKYLKQKDVIIAVKRVDN